MTEEERRALLIASAQASLHVMRKILTAGDTIDPEWRRLGWEGVDRALDALVEAMPDDELEERWRRLSPVRRSRELAGAVSRSASADVSRVRRP